MNQDWAMEIAKIELPNSPQSTLMRRVNEIVAENSERYTRVFAEVDIVFSEFVEVLQTTGTQRERDFVIVCENLMRVWKTLHISVQTMGEDLSPYDELQVVSVCKALDRLNLSKLIFNNLNHRVSGKVTELLNKEN